MCQGNEHFHEDFGDSPSVEERIPEHFFEDPIGFDEGFDEGFDDFEDEDFEDEDAELAQDQLLERQELEDFEGLNPFEDFDVGGESDW